MKTQLSGVMLGLGLIVCGPASAATVIGTFSNVDTTGTVIGGGFFDNSTSAVFSGLGTAVVDFGAPSSGTVTNALLFLGSTSFQNSGADEYLGTLFFRNGTVFLESLIFGIDLGLEIQETGGSVLGSDTIALDIRTTNNIQGSPAADADFVTFSLFDGTPVSMHAFEGQAFGVDLFGRVGSIEVNSVTASTIAFGAPENGFVGDGSIIPIPEPSSWAMMIAAFGVLGGALRLRRRRPAKLAVGNSRYLSS